MDLVYNIDLIAGLIRGIVDLFPEISDFINAAVRGGIDFNYIQSPALGYCSTHVAAITRFPLAIGKTVHRLSQNTPGAGFARSSGTVEKIGMGHTTASERITQCLCHRFLTDYLG
jgi:hypothetical protein